MVTRARTVVGGAFGTFLEWYDYSLYGFFATLFSQLFFPFQSKALSLTSVFAIFAIGYAARPLGSLILGRLADIYGRKWILVLSTLLIGLSTFLIGCLPTYQTSGILAPLLLLFFRFFQGLSVGGEYMNASAFLVEHAPSSHRGRYGSANNVAGGGGCLLASLAGAFLSFHYTSDELVANGAWRLPFLFGALTALVGVMIRLGLKETPVFEQLQKQGKTLKAPLTHAFTHQGRAMRICFGLVCLQSVSFYLSTVFLISWMVEFEKVPLSTSLLYNSLAFSIIIVVTFLSGWLSDLFGRKSVLLVAAIGFILLPLPLFWWMEGASQTWPFFFSQSLLAICFALYNGALPAALTELFTAPSRCSGMTVSYNLAAGIVGGLTPVICTSLILWTNSQSAPAYFLIFFALLSSLILIRE